MKPTRTSFLALACSAALVSTPAFAELDVSTFPSSVSIGVGGSVQLGFSVFALPDIGAVLQTQFPTAVTFQVFYDYDVQGYAGFTATGSQQGTGDIGYFWESFEPGYSYNNATFTYDKAGQFVIDYSYSASYFADIGGVVYDSNGDVLASGYGFAQDGESTSGSGEIDVTVGTVPEPSTWAMLLIGFAGIGFASYRRSAARLTTHRR